MLVTALYGGSERPEENNDSRRFAIWNSPASDQGAIVGRLVADNTRRRAIDEKDRRGKCVRIVSVMKIALVEKAPSHVADHTVVAFHDPILLGRVGT